MGNIYPYGGFEKFYETGQEQMTIATQLQSAGYRTMFVGKDLNGYPISASQTYIPPGWSEWYAYMEGGGLYFRYTLVSIQPLTDLTGTSRGATYLQTMNRPSWCGKCRSSFTQPE